MHNLDNYLAQVVETFFVYIMFFCRSSAEYIFPTLLADFKDPIQNWDGASSPPGGQSYIYLMPPLFFTFITKNMINIIHFELWFTERWNELFMQYGFFVSDLQIGLTFQESFDYVVSWF